MSEEPTYTKDPDAKLDYAFDWTTKGWLPEGDTINSFTVVVESGDVVIDTPAPAEAGGVVTVWISGGTPGVVSTVRCRITTAQGRTDDRTVAFHIEHR